MSWRHEHDVQIIPVTVTPPPPNRFVDFVNCVMLCCVGPMCVSQRGVIIRQWAWPEDGGRLLPAPSYQLNEFLSWHSTSSVTATLHFYCQHELVKFNVGMATEENRKHILPVGADVQK